MAAVGYSTTTGLSFHMTMAHEYFPFDQYSSSPSTTPFDLSDCIHLLDEGPPPGIFIPSWQQQQPPPPPPQQGGVLQVADLFGGTSSITTTTTTATAGAAAGQFATSSTTSTAAAAAAAAAQFNMTSQPKSRSRSSRSNSVEGGGEGWFRVAFRTKTEVDVLDDGFKWRKYGKKSVKNSPNPRNYYRCSTEGCSVKKRVERDRDDTSYVITTYDGVHNHTSKDVVYYATRDTASGQFVVSGRYGDTTYDPS